MPRIRSLRWWIAGLLACASALSYLDRQSFPVAVTEIQKQIAVSNRQYSVLQMLFLLAYSAMYAGGGKIADWLGTRLGYAILILWWSAATVLHGLVSTVFGLGIARFLLGFGEGGGFPCAAKAVSEWFPPEDRAFAFGIFNTGSSVGAVVAPPLIAFIILTLDWRWVFFITGTLGMLWALAWWVFYDLPQKQKLITPAELAHIEKSLAITQRSSISWLSLFRYRQVWALVGAKFLTDAAWFFFIFWLPKYLADVRHLNIKQIGYFAWIPYAAAGAGSFLGGWLSSILVRRHLSLNMSVCVRASAGLKSNSSADRLCCLFGGVGAGCELGEALDGPVSESGQYGGEICSDGYAETPAAFDDGEDSSDFGSCFFAAQVQPVLTPEGNGTHRVFSQVGG